MPPFWYHSRRGNLLVLFVFQVGILPKTAGGCRAFCRRLKPPSGRYSKKNGAILAIFATAPQLTLAAISAKLHLFFDRGTMPLNGKRGDNMATSSITANFYTDDPKAANAIVHALFTNVKLSPRPRRTVRVVEFKTEAEKRAFMRKVVQRARECHHA